MRVQQLWSLVAEQMPACLDYLLHRSLQQAYQLPATPDCFTEYLLAATFCVSEPVQDIWTSLPYQDNAHIRPLSLQCLHDIPDGCYR